MTKVTKKAPGQVKTDKIKAFMALPENRSYYEEERKKIMQEVITQRLKEIRKAKGLTQKELAERMGVKQPEIVRLEKGTNSTTLGTLISFLNAVDGRLEIIY
jgi:HTH-type transcriptional regulator / antitoxin HipB